MNENTKDAYELLWQCRQSGQIDDARWNEHLQYSDFAAFVRDKQIVPHAPVMTNTDALAAEMLAGLEGVTPGEWVAEKKKAMLSGYGERANIGVWSRVRLEKAVDDEIEDPEDSSWLLGIWGTIGDEDYANAAHIARCSPPNIRALLSEREEMKAELARLREALGKLAPAAEAHAIHNEETAAHYRAAYDAFPGAEGHRIFAEEYEAKAVSIRAALKGADHD